MRKLDLLKCIAVGLISIIVSPIALGQSFESSGPEGSAVEAFEIVRTDVQIGWNYYYYCGSASQQELIDSARFRLDHEANEVCSPRVARHLETTSFDYSCSAGQPTDLGRYEGTISAIYECEQ